MKPKDLKSPFNWEERQVVIDNRVWHIPRYCPDYSTFKFPGWNSQQLFGNDKPVIIEYCCGNGAWIAAKAKQHPEYNWVGVEMKFERVRKVWAKIQNYALDNLIVLCGEALLSTQLYIPDESVYDIYVNFPDPWPKNRHAKNRLLQGSFIHEMLRVLRKQGAVTVATDDVGYSAFLIEEFRAVKGFTSAYPAPFYVHEWPEYGDSYFDSLWRSQGKNIHYHRFVKEVP